jgi:bacterioferritin-associated ferredoxin
MHWSRINHSSGGINQLITNQLDPESKQPAFKQGQVQLRKLLLQSEAVLVSRNKIENMDADYWVSQKIAKGYLYFISDHITASELFEKLSNQFKLTFSPNTKLNRFSNNEVNSKQFSLLANRNNELIGLLTVWSGDIGFDSSWLSQALVDNPNSTNMGSVFSPSPYKDLNRGSPLCLCLNINRQQIHAAAYQQTNLQKVCEMTGAGKACGTCLGDIALELLKEKSAALQRE